MRKTFPNPYHFRGVTKMVSNPLSPCAYATMANFATVQKASARDAAPSPTRACLRPQLLQILQQLPFAQPSPVEVHFDEAVKKAKQLAQPKKKLGKKAEGGK
jgi:hypothetical protein